MKHKLKSGKSNSSKAKKSTAIGEKETEIQYSLEIASMLSDEDMK